MTNDYLRSPADVRGWPANPAARQALQRYLAALPEGTDDIEQLLDAEGLDFSGADLSGLDLTGADFSGAQDNQQLVDSTDLRDWFAEQGAPLIEVAPPRS